MRRKGGKGREEREGMVGNDKGYWLWERAGTHTHTHTHTDTWKHDCVLPGSILPENDYVIDLHEVWGKRGGRG